MASSSSTSPCAACKFLRRKCQPECVFAPYFPPDQPTKFANVHKVFGASNVTKLLNDLHPNQREDAVNSLAYEADMRLRDPVYGCVGVISILQHQLRQLQIDLSFAKSELSKYQSVGLAAHHQHHGSIMGGSFGRDHYAHQQLMIRSNYVDGTEALSRNMGAYDAGMLAVNVPTGGIRQLGSSFSPQQRPIDGDERRSNMGPS